jgi:hypothetical protein
MKNVLLLFVGFFVQVAFAQQIKLGKVTIEELQEKNHPTDTSAAPAYKFKTGKTNFYLSTEGNWTVITEVQVKIKVYNKNGLDNANHEVAYFIGGNTVEKVFFSDAYTYNLVNGKIEKTKLKSEGEFTEKVNNDWNLRKIVMPNVKEGSIIEYSYRVESPYITRINDFYFQNDVPIDYVEYAAFIPQYFVYRSVITGFETIDIKNENSLNQSFTENKTTYTGRNIPAIREEPFISNIRNYTAVLKYELASINYPNQSPKNLSLDWDGVTKDIYENDSFGKELKHNSYFEDELKSVLEKSSIRNERIKNILDFVRKKITWNEKNGIYCDKGVKKAFKDGTGNVAEINLMFVAMLRYAGISANPVLVSTKSNGIPVFPNRTVFNYVIAAVEIQDDLILLDATNSYSHFNILPTETLNWTGRLIRDSGSSTDVNLMPRTISVDKINILASIEQNGQVTGKLRQQHFDYYAFSFREENQKLSTDSYIEKLEQKYQGIEINDYVIKNKDDFNSPIIETFSFKHKNLVESIGNKLYFSPMMFFEKQENIFKQETRKFPLDYTVPFSDSFDIVVNIPEGYEVESLPESVNLAMENNYGTYSIKINSNFNNIQISSTFNINASIIPSEEYKTLKTFYKMMIDKQNEKIVLRKKA